jgi:hypothetical protein
VAKLKLGAIADDKPVKLTIELSVGVHRDLLAYQGCWLAKPASALPNQQS